MTAHKHFKQFVRSRMAKTGESYATARRQIIDGDNGQPARFASSRAPWHMPGSIPGATALRVIITAAGALDPKTKKPLSEAMLFGIAGGVGAGVAQFYYAKEDFVSFFIAGRHLWHDDEAYLVNALTRFGFKPTVTESSGAKGADKNLRAALEDGRPCVAWVDMANLPHRAMPAAFSGGGYHIITVYSIDDASGMALIGDLADEPIEIKLADLAIARARIKKFKNRVLTIKRCDKEYFLAQRIRSGIKACHAGLMGKPMKNFPTMFNLDALANFARRLHGSKEKESWGVMFPPGKKLWTALTSLYNYAELYQTGGGLSRPMMAKFLEEAADVHGEPKMLDLAKRYSSLGGQWTALAKAALPERVPLFKAARDACARRAEALAAGDMDEVSAAWAELDSLARRAAEKFPLTESECDALRRDLHDRATKIHAEEVAARDAMGELI